MNTSEKIFTGFCLVSTLGAGLAAVINYNQTKKLGDSVPPALLAVAGAVGTAYVLKKA